MSSFVQRHIGIRQADQNTMLQSLGYTSLDDLIDAAVPQQIRCLRPLQLPDSLEEHEALKRLRNYAEQNQLWRSYIGMGYHNTHTPSVILRNLIENPSWYTSYTPYQAEISQGRLEALLVFQTMVQDLTGMELSNCSLLDEATAAAEAMTMAHRLCKRKKANRFFVSNKLHPQSIRVIQARAEPLGIEVLIGNHNTHSLDDSYFAGIVQYPDTEGNINHFDGFVSSAKENGVLVCMATDLLSLTILKPPGELGADIVIGNSQRFGVPLGFGGPHAAFLATYEQFKKHMPGRIIGVSVDSDGKRALRMALQTREQHIRRAKATSNICTAQALLANVAAMYAVWHGPEGLKSIAQQVHQHTLNLKSSLEASGFHCNASPVFDTLCVETNDQTNEIFLNATDKHINLRQYSETKLVIALDETTTAEDIQDLIQCFGAHSVPSGTQLPSAHVRESSYLDHPIFHSYRSETEMMRYLHTLAAKDLALDTAMIPLGSCTMKLNAATEMIPVTWPEFNGLHPYAPEAQFKGYTLLIDELNQWLAEITGFDAISMQPNAGSQGEYAGLLTIRAYHHANNNHNRHICLIPTSAHGTNPASAVMAGMKVVAVKCDSEGNIDMLDLQSKADKHSDDLAALMVTYPSTHGVFEESIREVCDIIHQHGGQVYMDGANTNALVGLCRPGDIGADVCHLNLHKTFCIPHGGGGPGMGPIGVKSHLAPHLPGNPSQFNANPPVSAAPFGSPSILPISWAYIAMMGPSGLTEATKVAILSANYIATRLKGHFDVLYTGKNGLVAHECILDFRGFKKTAQLLIDDVAKRLIDFGFHAPTMSWPVRDTLMVEPTESEPLSEIDRFIDAMIAIRAEIADVENGSMPIEDSPLRHAPHTAEFVTSDNWSQKYTRKVGAFPAPFALKYWPPVRRVDNAYGDRHLACSCTDWRPEDLE
ncbi:MAG: aminomethyl-transferring glycine dehydrogenase [Myxococcota bacterium]